MSTWCWSLQAIMCCDLFQTPPAVSIDILRGNYRQDQSVRGCISTSRTINMRIIERECMNISTNHAHVQWEKDICWELPSVFPDSLCTRVCTRSCVIADPNDSVDDMWGSLLLAQDAVIFPVSHWQGAAQIEGQTVITMCGDSQPVPI